MNPTPISRCAWCGADLTQEGLRRQPTYCGPACRGLRPDHRVAAEVGHLTEAEPTYRYEAGVHLQVRYRRRPNGDADLRVALRHALERDATPDGRRRALCGADAQPFPHPFLPHHPDACRRCSVIAARRPPTHRLDASNDLARITAILWGVGSRGPSEIVAELLALVGSPDPPAVRRERRRGGSSGPGNG